MNYAFLLQVFSSWILVGLFCCLLGLSICQQLNKTVYLGNFQQPSHGINGDIFFLDEKIFYIQDFAHDGRAPDVVFRVDGVPTPYVTNNIIIKLIPEIALNLK